MSEERPPNEGRSVSSVKRKRKRLALYYRQGGHCYYCGEKMRHPNNHRHVDGITPHPRTCTLEHLDSRLNPDRGRRVARYRTVAACLACNNRQAEREREALGPDYWRLRSARKKNLTAGCAGE